MPIRPIELYPSPILRAIATEADPRAPAVAGVIAADMWETLDSHSGVGLAAPQIGVSSRIIVVDASRAKRPVENHGRLTLLNPRIVASEGEIAFREGCLSIPDLVARVPRAANITVEALLPNGEEFTLTTTGFEAVILQHEIDHLNGILFIDRVRSARDIKIRVN